MEFIHREKGVRCGGAHRIGIAIWLAPVPANLSPQAWNISPFLLLPSQLLPSGAVMLIALCVAIFTQTLIEAKALSDFASGTVWLIFCAYILSLGMCHFRTG
ncbi:MAG: anion permease [Symbiopectobacterium sp.]